MSTPDFAAMRQQYVELFGDEGVSATVVNEIERQLGVALPNDVKEISKFYGGGILGGISHHAFAIGPADNVVQETLRLRDAIGLPHRYIVLAEPTDSLVVLDCEANGRAAVIWCDAHELVKLPAIDSLAMPDIWPSYADFFAQLLGKEKTGV